MGFYIIFTTTQSPSSCSRTSFQGHTAALSTISIIALGHVMNIVPSLLIKKHVQDFNHYGCNFVCDSNLLKNPIMRPDPATFNLSASTPVTTIFQPFEIQEWITIYDHPTKDKACVSWWQKNGKEFISQGTSLT